MINPLISIILPTYNEESNIDQLYLRITKTISQITQYQFEILFIDNASTDKTAALIRQLCIKDSRVKLISCMRNFGHIRSPYWGILQTSGIATIYLASDLQDPPELIPQFITEWEKGWKVVYGTKHKSQTNGFMHQFRKIYYCSLSFMADFNIEKNATGFGIYDQQVVNLIRQINDPYPFLRGMICDLGFPIKTIEFNQPVRKSGTSKNNFYTLLDIGILGFIKTSTKPLRFVSILCVLIGLACFLICLLNGLINWHSFSSIYAFFTAAVFLMLGCLFIFIGILSEYLSSIHISLKNYPIVVEKERINF